QLEAMAALSAAQIEDLAVRLYGCGGEDEVHVAARVLHVLDDVAVGLDVESVEKLTPPFGGEMCFEIRDGTETRTRRYAPLALRLGNRCHDGRMSSKGRALTRGILRPPQPAIGRTIARPLWPQ